MQIHVYGIYKQIKVIYFHTQTNKQYRQRRQKTQPVLRALHKYFFNMLMKTTPLS